MKHPRNVRPADPQYFGQANVAAKLQAAGDVLAGPHRTCGHITSVAARSICGWHPRSGEMCDRCIQRHVEVHAHTCVDCGQLAGVLDPVEAAWGSTVVAGLGNCQACR